MSLVLGQRDTTETVSLPEAELDKCQCFTDKMSPLEQLRIQDSTCSSVPALFRVGSNDLTRTSSPALDFVKECGGYCSPLVRQSTCACQCVPVLFFAFGVGLGIRIEIGISICHIHVNSDVTAIVCVPVFCLSECLRQLSASES